jgi:predicted SAM-dependent methyltransferase
LNLDIACGQAKPEGWVGIDLADCPGVDIRHDLSVFPWPIDSGVVTEARCSHYFEHVPRLDRPRFMSEVWRILAPDSGIVLITPLGMDRQLQDFSHEWPVVPTSYLYFNRPWLRTVKMGHYIDLYGLDCNFEIASQYIVPVTESVGDANLVQLYRSDLSAQVDLLTVLRKIPLEA